MSLVHRSLGASLGMAVNWLFWDFVEVSRHDTCIQRAGRNKRCLFLENKIIYMKSNNFKVNRYTLREETLTFYEPLPPSTLSL